MVARRSRRMMGNSSLPFPPGAPFTLGAYSDPGPWRWLYFTLVLCVFALIAASNLLLVAVIALKPRLHQPMFIFLCSLFVNELLGSGALFPFLLFQLLQDEHRVPYGACFLQVFFIHTYGGVEFTNLAVMAYDRYLAICRPLQYQRLMTPRRVAAITATLWVWGVASVLVALSLTLPLRFCGHVVPKVYCDNYSLVRLACSDTTANNAYGLAYIFTALPALIGLILYSYGRILLVVLGGGRVRHKALNTCTPHLVSLLSFSFGAIFEMVQSRFDMSHAPMTLRILLSLYFLTVQPLLNPLLYGIKLRQVRNACRELLLRHRSEE